MKIQISFDFTDLTQALDVAEKVKNYTDIFEVGICLIYKYGENSVRSFKEKFPDKIILANSQIIEKGKDGAQIFAQAGADWITVMAGADKHAIHKAIQNAHELDKKVMLNMLDSCSIGQTALEAKSLGADALLFHPKISEDRQMPLMEQWEMVKGNTTLPIYMAAYQDTFQEIIKANPSGIVFGSIIFKDVNPVQKAAELYSLINKTNIDENK